MSSTFLEFLDNKPLYYDEIDYDRMPHAYAKIKEALTLPRIVHLVGTNGKGTTGRFMANGLLQSGMNVGHYTSPHILSFNERIWLNGNNADDKTLQRSHETVFGFLGKETADALSYFEYTTLMAMAVFEPCDIVVLEAGLGGEYDATNVFEKELSIFTPIDFDHQAFLGDTIEAIASTKLRSMAKTAILGEQPHKETARLFDMIGKEKGSKTYRVSALINENAIITVEKLLSKEFLPYYLTQNLKLAIAGLNVLDVSYTVQSMIKQPMFGRLTKLNEHIYLDVGHNVLAAKAITASLQGQQFTLVYNSYKDKEIFDILQTLKPIIESVEIIDVDDVRIEQRQQLEAVLCRLHISYSHFSTIKKDKKYLVFGSFSVAEAFLKCYK